MIRVALVGTGGMARNYRMVYADLPDVEWSLAVDVSEEELTRCREQGAKRISTNFADALGDDIDVVDISTPNHLHAEQAVAALEAGKHVLLQKPMSNTLEGADRILDAAAKARGRLGMYMSSYTNPLVWELKKLVDSGAMGQIQSVRARDAHRGGLRAAPGLWRNSLEQTGGGSFIQLSIHAINLVQWWLDRRIVEVSAYSANQYSRNIGGDDVTVAVVKFDETARARAQDARELFGVFDSGYASEGMTREVYATQGHFQLIHFDRTLDLVLDEPYESQFIRYTTPGKVARFSAPTYNLGDATGRYNQQRLFLEAIRDGRAPAMSGPMGRQDLAVVMAVYESAAAGAPVRVKQRPGNP